MIPNEIQTVIITFQDNTKAVYAGKAVVRPGDTRQIVNIQFTVPTQLPQGMSWKQVNDNESPKAN